MESIGITPTVWAMQKSWFLFHCGGYRCFKHFYPEYVYKYLDAKYPKDFPILKPKIDEFYQQGIKPDRIYNLMSQYIDLKPHIAVL